MMGFVVKLGFWSAMVLLAMPSSRRQVMNHDFAPASLISAGDLALRDVGDFCAHSITLCDSAADMTSQIALFAKTSCLKPIKGFAHNLMAQIKRP